MSLISKEMYGWVVVCDVCQSIGALCERDWREMGTDANDQPIHLCRACQKTATWCEHHRCYHRPGDNHRRPCAACGGLFTAKVAAHHEYCPSCRPDVPAPAPSPAYSLISSLVLARLLQRLHSR